MNTQGQNDVLFARELDNSALIEKFRVTCQSISNQDQLAYLWDIADHRIDADTYFEILKTCPYVKDMEKRQVNKIRRRIEDRLRKVGSKTILQLARMLELPTN